ncbi:MAG: GWxTD domain-containing protein [Sediminibacterium sp.]|nr:GWxTD domain-containing protein [Sediminibacterium sp.]
MMRFLSFLLFLSAGILLLSCQSRRIPTKSTKSGTHTDEDVLEVYTKAYHLNDSVTRVYYEINNKTLIYRRADTGSSVFTRLQVHYKLFADASGKTLSDSSTFNIYDVVNGDVSEKMLRGSFLIKQKTGLRAYLEMNLLDWNRKVNYLHELRINKTNKATAENYLIYKNNEAQVHTHFLKGDILRVEAVSLMDQPLKAEFMRNDFAIALPPFSAIKPDPVKYAPDSTFTIPLVSHSFTLTMPDNGFVHIRNDASKTFEGLTLYTYDETFPGVSNTQEMIGCTRYIMNKQEFETCKKAANPKEVIDNFWIELGGSEERAKRLLKSYYGRVKLANRDYTSYHQGWKTDRGMIYIVFGEPSRIYKTKNGELWIYGQETAPGALKFMFNKSDNPYTENDYLLERNDFYKEGWYSAVDYWRQGHVYTNNMHE